MKIVGTRVIGAALLSAVTISVACSSSSSDDSSSNGGSGGTAGKGGSGGKGGAAGHAGTATNQGGRAGSVSTGGTATDQGGEAGMQAAAGAGGANPCAACASGICLPGGQCVDCLPANDTCAAGTYCTADNKCVPGCKDADSCASGVCTATHDCQNCIADSECAGGKLCGAGQCNAPCAGDGQGGAGGAAGASSESCAAALDCCSQHCVDSGSDSAHCGVCDTACDATSFCGSGTCHPTLVSNVCTIGKVAVLLDGQATDEDAGRAIATALTAGCTTPPTVREIAQTSSDLLAVSNPTTGQPVAGADELLITAGGFFFEKVVGYEEQHPSAPIYAKQVGQTDEYVRRSDDSVVSTFSVTENTSDYVFAIQLIRDPASGSLILNAQGFFPGATSIASEYLSTVIIPALSTYTKSWYVFHWVDSMGGDQMLQPGEVTLVQSG